jgi:hypothetical protein
MKIDRPGGGLVKVTVMMPAIESWLVTSPPGA